MGKLKIYLDSTIIGFSVNNKDEIKYEEANLLLTQIKNGIFDAYISYLTLREIGDAPEWISRLLLTKVEKSGLTVLRESTETIQALKKEYLDRKVVPIEFPEDAEHIAIATTSNSDALVSYNFKHIVRVETMVSVNRVNEEFKFKELFLCQPSEVILYEET